MIWEKIFNGWFVISDDWNSIWWLILNSERFMIESFNDITNTDINLYKKVKQNWNELLENWNTNKNIEINLVIKWKNSDDLRKNINELRKVLFNWIQLLKINYLWEYRFLDVLCESNNLNFEHYNTHWLKTTIRFVSLLPYWSSGILERKTINWINNHFSDLIENIGTAESELKVYINPTHNNWCSELSLKIEDKELFFRPNWNEKIEIDTKNLIVKVWNSQVEWWGEFNKFKSGKNNFTLKRNNWEFNFNLDILFEKNYV